MRYPGTIWSAGGQKEERGCDDDDNISNSYNINTYTQILRS